ncbi:MAG: hypothetical protein R2757_08875 [Draconibacterium sp.]
MVFIQFITFFIAFSVFNLSQKPAERAEVYLLDSRGEVVAFQKTGEKGKTAFQYIEDGNYRIMLVFPQQEGKYLKEKRRHRTLTKAAYNEKNKTYYYQGKEGYFSVKFSGTKRIDTENFKAIFHENKDGDESEIEVVQFQTKRKGAQISVQVKKMKAKQFNKITRKVGNDISLFSIPGIK